MIKLALAGIIVIIIIFALILIIRNKPDFWFWIFLNFFFDPGGYVYGFLGTTVIGPLHITDVCITGIVICMMSAKINWQEIFTDNFLNRFLIYLIIFSFYFFVVYGGISPYLHNDFNYSTFLIKNRVFAYGFIVLIAVYAFSLRSLYYFYTSTLLIGVICLTLYFLSLITGIVLVPIEEGARYAGDDMIRISMVGYGLFYILFPISIITYLISQKINIYIKYKKWLYYSGIVMLITLLITLTRRTQIDIIATVLVIILIISYLFRTGKISSILKIIIPVIIVTLIMSFTFPKYIGFITEIGEDTFLLITTGKDSRGVSDQRVSGNEDYKIVEDYISNNLLIGTGYTYLSWEEKGYASSPRGPRFSLAADAAGEVPIYNLVFGFGILGAILMLPLYLMMLKLFLNIAKTLKVTIISYLTDPLIIIFSIYILLSIAQKFTYKLYNLSLDFTGANLSSTAVFMGVAFALYRRLQTDSGAILN